VVWGCVMYCVLLPSSVGGLVWNLDLVAGVLLCVLSYVVLVRGPKFSFVNMRGKVVVVTGSNTGIGLETAREVARMGATVILACRTPSKAKAAVEDIIKSSGNASVSWMQLDLTDRASILKFVKDLNASNISLDVLINNAGIMRHDRRVSSEGIELTLLANHLGPFLLTQLLLDKLNKSEDGRIVNVNSSLHHTAHQFDFEDPHLESGYEMFKAYARSKLAGVLYTYELDRRLREQNVSNVTANCLHPGQVLTDVSRNMHWFYRYGEKAVYPLNYIFRKTPSQGAWTSIHVATSPLLKGIGGKYFVHCEAVKSSPLSYDKETAKKIWEFSEKVMKYNDVCSEADGDDETKAKLADESSSASSKKKCTVS